MHSTASSSHTAALAGLTYGSTNNAAKVTLMSTSRVAHGTAGPPAQWPSTRSHQQVLELLAIDTDTDILSPGQGHQLGDSTRFNIEYLLHCLLHCCLQL
jgi:hypothetical protein